MLNKILNILFPETCPVCQKPSSDHKTAPICADCWATVKPYEGSSCIKCGTPLVSDLSSTCGECHKNEPFFDNAQCFGLHEGALQKAISLFKFHGIKRLSYPLSEKILLKKLPQADILLPVPLHKKRLKYRGFNQSALLGKYIAQRSDMPLSLNTLVRIKNTVPQVGLSAVDRERNIKNAFDVVSKEKIKGKRVMLVDDVFTTGATVRECSMVLKQAGAEKVYVVTLTHGKLD